MIPRKQTDIGWADFAFAALACAGLGRRKKSPADAPLLTRRGDSLTCLAVRSGLDLLLTELAWPAGDEVIVSAITIPDISHILREHGLVPVSVDIDPDTLAMDNAALERAVTPRTRAVLVAHLFGARLPLGGVITWAHARGLAVWEDCAQAWTGGDFLGHEASDVRMFSFGPIKTATALGGGVLLVRDAALLTRLRARHAAWPVQRTGEFFRRVAKFAFFHPLLSPWPYGALVCVFGWLGRDHDKLVTQLGRGFVGGHFFTRLRRQPCAPLVALLERRLATYDRSRVARRAAAGERVRTALHGVPLLGGAAEHRTHWLFPLRVRDPKAVMRALWREGIDATCASSSLHALPGAPRAEAAMTEVLYVPVLGSLDEAALDRLAARVASIATVQGSKKSS